MTDTSSRKGGIDRAHDASLGAKAAFALMHAGLVGVCVWLAFGGFDFPDSLRAIILAFCALLYFLRHLVTLFVLLQRKVELSEVFGLIVFMALFEVGFVLLGSGMLSGAALPFRAIDGIGLALVGLGSYLNTGSELQRRAWKKRPTSKGQCYTEGLFAHSAHINYFGDSVLFTGWAILTGSVIAGAIPLLMTVMFIFFHIPALDAYLAKRYGEAFEIYARNTAKFVPYVY